MLYEIKGVCNFCAAEYKLVVAESEAHGICPECGNKPIRFKKFKGMIYVVKNPNQSGVKVGLTSKDIAVRIKQLSSTGVPGKFKVIAIFPSDHLEDDEAKAHEKLKKYILDKEHFDINEIDAVLAVHRALNRRTPIFQDKKIEYEFNAKLQESKDLMKARLGSQTSTED
jgi:hypothetical protein